MRLFGAGLASIVKTSISVCSCIPNETFRRKKVIFGSVLIPIHEGLNFMNHEKFSNSRDS